MNKTKFMQTDSRWGSLGYPKKPYYLRNCGCGEVSIANIIIEMQKYANYTPATIQPYCKQYADPKGNGTYWSGIPKMMKNYGLTEVKEHATMKPLWDELAKGNRVAIYLMGSRKGGSKGVKWTSGGHFVCSVAYKYENGKHWVYVKDSYSFASNRNGWITYEENMRNDVLKVWSGKLNGTLYGETEPTPTPQPADGKLVVDGIGGLATVQRLQEFLGVSKTDGITIKKDLQKYVPALKAYDYGDGSLTVLAMQKWLGISQDGLWGSGTSKALQKKVGATQDGIFGTNSMKKLQEYLNTHDKADYPQSTWVDDANIWAKLIANSKYHYVVWQPKVNATHTCPICTGRKYDNYYGWNCIGFASAVWHHGGGLKSTCNCHTISNEIGEKMLKVSDAEALAIAKKQLGISSLAVIRNKNGIPKAQWKAGDLCLQFSGNTYKHMFYYMGNGKIADSKGSNGKVPRNEQIAVRSYDNYSAKVIIRYTGKTEPVVEKKSYDGEYPDTNVKTTEKIDRGKDIAAKANEFAWAYGTAASKYAYKTGSARATYVAALKKYMNKSAKISQTDCGYFSSTCVRASGVASNFLCLPASGTKPYPALPSTMQIAHKGKMGNFVLKAGDVVRWQKTNKHQHTVVILDGGKIAHASRSHAFPRVAKATPWTASNTKTSTLQVLRATPIEKVVTRNYLEQGDTGEEVKKLQKYINWFFQDKYKKDVLKVDGSFGPATQNYAKLMQSELGFKDCDGLVGPKTVEAMKNYKR